MTMLEARADAQNIYKEQEEIFPFSEAIPRNVDIRTLAKGGLRLVIPSKGELAEGALSYVSSLGWMVGPSTTRNLSENVMSGVKVVRQRAEDALVELRNGSMDMAILGADVICENRLDSKNDNDIIPLNCLGFGGCTFRIGFPFDKPTPTEEEFFESLKQGKKIATSLPNILTAILKPAILKKTDYELKPEQIITMSGGVEAAPAIYEGKVIAVADRVSSGDTMLANNLFPGWTLWTSPGAYLATSRDFYIDRITPRIGSRYLSWDNYVTLPERDVWIS